jgi:hypothetical protein
MDKSLSIETLVYLTAFLIQKLFPVRQPGFLIEIVQRQFH